MCKFLRLETEFETLEIRETRQYEKWLRSRVSPTPTFALLGNKMGHNGITLAPKSVFEAKTESIARQEIRDYVQ